MNDLLQMRIFGLLSEALQEVTNEEMQNAYGEFVEQIRIVGMEVTTPLSTVFLQLPILR